MSGHTGNESGAGSQVIMVGYWGGGGERPRMHCHILYLGFVCSLQASFLHLARQVEELPAHCSLCLFKKAEGWGLFPRPPPSTTTSKTKTAWWQTWESGLFPMPVVAHGIIIQGTVNQTAWVWEELGWWQRRSVAGSRGNCR